MTINVDLWKTLIDLKKCKWVDLTHAFGSDTPKWSGFKAEKIETLFTIEKDGIFVNQYTFPGQYGTHMDAPGHFAAGKRLIEDIELKEMVLPLVVIDCSEKFKENPDYELTLEDLLAFEAEYGIIPEGSFVAMRTDWVKIGQIKKSVQMQTVKEIFIIQDGHMKHWSFYMKHER
ncbi:cyclase family protein [Clostridium ljungdahlii]|uniref:cyclase family protein n=1 Tax=Clostridium ljungdahlii TaxID=1538 RepID=UPI00386500F2